DAPGRDPVVALRTEPLIGNHAVEHRRRRHRQRALTAVAAPVDRQRPDDIRDVIEVGADFLLTVTPVAISDRKSHLSSPCVLSLMSGSERSRHALGSPSEGMTDPSGLDVHDVVVTDPLERGPLLAELEERRDHADPSRRAQPRPEPTPEPGEL